MCNLKAGTQFLSLFFRLILKILFFDFGPIDTQELLRRCVAFRRRAGCRISSAGFAYLEAWNAPENAESSNPNDFSSLFLNQTLEGLGANKKNGSLKNWSSTAHQRRGACKSISAKLRVLRLQWEAFSQR